MSNNFETGHKETIIEKIKEAEELAKSIFKTNVKQELFELEQKKINNSHYLEMLLKLLASTINSYDNLKNYYKASNEQFAFLKSDYPEKLTDEDRLDFIAMIFASYLDFEATTKEEIETKLEVFNQLENIDNIVLETRLLELKCIEYKKVWAFIESKADALEESKSQPQQSGTKKPDEVKKELHNNIFKDDAFEIWQSMFEKFEIIASKRTDIDFMFQVMKYNNLIYKNIGLKDIKDWINTVYEISFEKIRYTDPKSTANEKRLIIYKDIISK